MSTEYEMMLAMMERSGIIHRTVLVADAEYCRRILKYDPTAHYMIYLFDGGYDGFWTEFTFDKEGRLLRHAAYESLDAKTYDADRQEFLAKRASK